MKKGAWGAVIASCIVTHAFASDKQPFSGMVYNTKELSALTYECGLARDERMTCKFTQLAVRKQSSEQNLKKKLLELDSLMAREKLTSKQCKEMQEIFDMYDGKRAPKEPLKFKDPRDKEAAERSVSALKQVCETGDTAALRRNIEDGYRLEARTCRVSANNFEQTFRLVKDIEGKFSWVVDEPPSGDCGLVQLSRFELDKSDGVSFWNYIARKAVTNPSGSNGLFKCSEFDEDTYPYSWKATDGLTWADCEKVEFSYF